MRRRGKRWRWRLEYALLATLFGLSRLVPWRPLVALGRLAGLVAYHGLGVRRGVTLANLRAAFGGERSERELRRLAARTYSNLGATLMEFCKLYDLPRERLAGLVVFTGLEHVAAATAGGRGALLTTGHFGNWELLGAAVAARGRPVHYLIKEQSNPHVDRLQNEIRRRAGIGVIRQGAAARHLMYALRRGELVGILGDQDAGSQGVFLDFLGRPASVARGVAYFAWRTGRPIVPVTIRRLPDGRHQADFTPPIAVDPAWDEETAVRTLTRLHTERLERAVRACPDHYFWVHRRWKTRPPA